MLTLGANSYLLTAIGVAGTLFGAVVAAGQLTPILARTE